MQELKASYAKLEWAEKKAAGIVGRLAAYEEPSAYEITETHDLRLAGFRLYLVEGLKAVEPQLQADVGAILKAFRESLDNAVFEISNAHCGDPGKIAFPVTDSPERFAEFRSKKMDPRLPPAVWSSIETLQPYQDGRAMIGDLHDAANEDKHRSGLLKLVPFPSDIAFKSRGSGYVRRFAILSADNHLFPGIPLGALDADPECYVDLQPRLAIAHGETLCSNPVMRSLQNVHAEVLTALYAMQNAR